MPEHTAPRHGLEPLLAALPSAVLSTAGPGSAVTVCIRSDLGLVNLRGSPADAGFLNAMEAVLGQTLPVQPNTISRGPHSVYWLGPDEWLVAAQQPQPAALIAELRDASVERNRSITDQSGGLVALVLSGAAADDILAKGCTLDLHPSVFPAGRCAQSGLARVNLLLARAKSEEGGGFELFVRRSFADYLLRWLARAGEEWGIRFDCG